MTSTKSTDEALIDFVLADTRMGGVHIYKKKGCKTESAILQVADGTVSRWPDRSGTSPIPHNLDGHLTFVSPVVKKVKNGSIFFELCLVSDDGLVHANGKTKQEAIMKYLAEMAKNPNVYAASTSAKDTTDTIVVDRIGDDLQGSLKMFLFNARQKYPGRIFIGSTLTSPALALTQPGDTVEVTFALGETERVNLKKFSNPAIPLDISHAQKVLNRKEDKREQTQANEEKAASIKNQILEMDDQALIRWLERGGGLDNLPPRQEIQVEPENQN